MALSGRYEVSKDGKTKRVSQPTATHPEGNAPRDPDGNRLDRPKQEPASKPSKEEE